MCSRPNEFQVELEQMTELDLGSSEFKVDWGQKTDFIAGMNEFKVK